MAILLYLMLLIGLLVLNYYLAKWFSQIAEEKGFFEKRYFWLTFFLGIAGMLMVVALPDRRSGTQAAKQLNPADEIPDL